MSGDNPRFLELQRRVQADPASLAFAQLAEEWRRDGNNDAAIEVSRAGLQHHPDYLSARITLARALIELHRLDEAHEELNVVLSAAPDNLAAQRARAEAYQQGGRMDEALAHYRRALELAKYDPELEDAVERIEHVVAPAEPQRSEAPAVAVEDLFDFDRLLEQLGGRTQPAPSQATSLTGGVSQPPVTRVPSIVQTVQLRDDDRDPFSVLERHLRVSDEQRAQEERETQQVVRQLEDWLSTILFHRSQQQR